MECESKNVPAGTEIVKFMYAMLVVYWQYRNETW